MEASAGQLALWAVIALVLVALAFDFLNGFHDAANSIATVVSTRVLKPYQAVLMAAFFNFAAMFVFQLKVATTVGQGIVDQGIVDHYVVLGALLGAIAWNLITWFYGIPSSSSHALIGGLVGAAVAKAGTWALIAPGILKTVAFIFVAPVMGMAFGAILMLATSWLFVRSTPSRVDRWFRRAQLVSASLVRRGGSLRADIRLEGPGRERIREALVTGDFFISPTRALFDLEAALRGVAVAEAGATVEAFFAGRACELPGLSPLDFREVVESALAQISLKAAGHQLRGHWRGEAKASTTLVFLHDALGSVRLWRDFPDQLVRATGCRALLYDRLGSGESDALAPPYSRDYLAEEALQALPQVLAQTGVREAILIGQSDGASIALAHAGAFPERVRGVIALSPHLFREAKTLEAIGRQIADFERGDLKTRLRRHHGPRTERLFERLVEVWTAGPAGTGWGLEAHVAKVRCPVLAIQGEDDEFFSAAQLEALRRLVPHLEVMRIPGAGHYPMHQARNEVLAPAIRFIRSLTAASTGTSSSPPSPR